MADASPRSYLPPRDLVDRATFLPIGQYADGSLTLAWPGFLKDAYDGAVRSAVAQEGPPIFDDGGQYVSGATMRDEDPFMAASIAPAGAFGARATGLTKDVGDLGIFAGRGAKTADHAKLAQAEQMVAEGASRGGITAYHGSPHDFDRFSLDKIGSGEGAQAYGHGLYFAEAEDVAKSYRDGLSFGDGDTTITLGGRRLDREDPLWEVGLNAEPGHTIGKSVDYWNTAWPGRFQNLVDAASKYSPDSTFGRGRMYEVRINAEPEQFLDWDIPVSAQRESVRRPLTELGLSDSAKSFNVLQGIAENLRVRGRMAGDRDLSVQVSDTLRDAGIPGIRYLDQGSRVAGDGTYNYVVFDDNLVDIMRKYANPETAALPYLMTSATQGDGNRDFANVPAYYLERP